MTNTFNSANQLTGNGTDSFEYDSNGNLWKTNSVVSHTWDKANRLLSHGGLDYAYDGLGNRISQDNGANITKYLLDMHPVLPRVLSAFDGSNTDYFIHAGKGIHAVNSGGSWHYLGHDGLGSVRFETDNIASVLASKTYSPYGSILSSSGTFSSSYGYAGQMIDDNGLSYNQHRYYSPAMATWTTMDALETPNRYAYVNSNPIRFVDPSGLQALEAAGTCVSAVLADGPAPVGDVICGLTIIGAGLLVLAGATSHLAQLAPEILEQMTNRYPSIGQDIPDITATQAPPIATATAIPRNATAVAAPFASDSSNVTATADATAIATSTPDNNNCSSKCGTQDGALSTAPFGGTMTPEADMLCHLSCYNGEIPATIYGIGLRALGTGFQVIGGNDSPQGVFFEPNQPPGTGLAVLGMDGASVNTNNRGGTIVVRQPVAGQINRATRLATLVEEITHASIFHEYLTPPLPRCSEITKLQNEAAAKLAKLAWIGLSEIPISAFANTEVTDFLGTLRRVSNPRNLAFSRVNCVGAGYASVQRANVNYVEESSCGIGCINPYVEPYLPNNVCKKEVWI